MILEMLCKCKRDAVALFKDTGPGTQPRLTHVDKQMVVFVVVVVVVVVVLVFWCYLAVICYFVCYFCMSLLPDIRLTLLER